MVMVVLPFYSVSIVSTCSGFDPNTIKITATIAFVAIIISLKVMSCAEYKNLIKIGSDTALR